MFLSIYSVEWLCGLVVVAPLVVSIRVNDTCLPALALQINKTLSRPWGTSDQLMRDLFVYFEELEGTRKEIKQGMEEGLDPKKDLPQQFKKFQEVNETGGPTHLQSNIDIKHLVKHYTWDRDNIAEFYELLDFTRTTWKKLNLLFDEDKPAVLTFQDKLKKHLWKEKG